MPARDMVWFICDGKFDGNSWFCACCGKQYNFGMEGFLFGIQTTDDPASIIWYVAEPLEGKPANYLDYMKMGTAIFNGNFSHEE